MFIFFHIFGHKFYIKVFDGGYIDVKLSEKLVRRDFCISVE